MKSRKSHPSWVCGLKQSTPDIGSTIARSHPSWVCGLKQSGLDAVSTFSQSHPSWVCGLKLSILAYLASYPMSHPSWVCGLKHPTLTREREFYSHTLRGCVDWNRKQILFSEPTWKSHFYENVPLIVNKLQWQKIWFGTSLSGLSLVLYSNL